MASNNAEKGYKIATNYIYSLLYHIFTIITPLITTPYISRVLGATNIGIYGYVESICIYFIVMGNLGFPLLGQREIAYNADDLKKRSTKFADVMIGKTFFLSISLAAYIIFSLFFAPDNNIIFLSYALGMVADLVNVGWFFQGLEDFRTTVMRNFIIKIISIISIFVFVRTPDDLLAYSLLINAANLIGNGAIVFSLRKEISLKDYKFDVKRITVLIKPALILAIPYYISQIYTVINKTMLGWIGNDYAQVGFYDQAQKIITFSVAIVTALGAVFMPRIAKEVESNEKENVQYFLNKGIDVILLISVPLFAGLICIGDMMVPWFFGPGYDQVGLLIMTFSPITLFLGMNSFLGNQYLVSAKREKLLTVMIFIGVVVNVGLNLLLIPLYASMGAVVATVISEICKLAFLIITLRKTLDIKYLLTRSLRYVLLTLPMLAVGLLLKSTVLSSFTLVNTLILIIVCGVVYLAALIITKNETLTALLGMVKKKILKRDK
ncbi:MAG: flippase [Clostridia bacterium]|nr:flippase [Clostridia bacterium]